MDRSELWFGIDGGSKSLGWAALRRFESGEIVVLDCSSHIFHDGVINEKGRFSTATGQRRDARQMRRQTLRTKRRKAKVANAIRRHLCKFEPASMSNPIPVRGGEGSSVHDFASAIYHIAGRRGFKSIAKTAPVVEPVSESIGAEMHRLTKEGKPILLGVPTSSKNRKRSVRSGLDFRADARPKQDHIKAEFGDLWDRAASLYPDRFTPEAKREIEYAIFHRRPLKDCEDLIGPCSYIPKEKNFRKDNPEYRRVRKDDPEYQRFRIVSELSNVKLVSDDGESVELTDHPDLIAKMADDLMVPEAKPLTWSKIATEVKKITGVKMHIPSKAAREKEGGTGIKPILVPDPEDTAVPMAKICLVAAREMLAYMTKHGVNESEAKEALIESGVFENPRINSKTVPLTGKMLTIDEIAEIYQPIDDPSVGVIYNQTKRILDWLVRRFGMPDRINIESAREIGRGRKAYESKFAFERRMKKKESERLERLANRDANEKNPLRRRSDLERLIEIHGDRCFFFPEEPATDIGHIIPLSKSGDDRMSNKVPISARANALMGDRAASEFIADRPDAKRAVEVNLLALEESDPELHKAMAWRFEADALRTCEAGFRKNAMNEYRIAEKMMSIGLMSVCRRVSQPRAKLTAAGRRWYRLDRKDRNDHRHHAEDAILIALAPSMGREFPAGITGEAIRKAVSKAVVTHRVKKAKNGKLHEDGARGAATDKLIWRGNHYRAHSTGGNWATEIYDVDGKWESVTITRFDANQKGFRAGTTFRPTRNAKLVKRVFVDDVLTIAGDRVSGFKGGKEVVKFMPDRSKPRRRWRVQKMSAGKFVLACVNASGGGKEMETWTISAKQLQASLIL